MSKPSSKKSLRESFHSLRLEHINAVQEKILMHIYSNLSLASSLGKIDGHIGIYWPLDGEIDLRSLRQTLNIPLALPACENTTNLAYHSWSSKPLKKDSLKIPSSLNNPKLEAHSLSLLLIPAVAIDYSGFRLGYGGGYYDRLRANDEWRSIPSFGVVPEACISDNSFPRDWWDIPLDGWFTENGISYVLNKEKKSNFLQVFE